MLKRRVCETSRYLFIVKTLYRILYYNIRRGDKIEAQKLYTATEAANIIGVHPNTVKRWHKEGYICAVSVGDRWLRFPEREIKRILGE